MNVHTMPRTIYLSRHGQSEYNVLKKIGGNSSLSDRGEQYSQSLADWIHENVLKEGTTTLRNLQLRVIGAFLFSDRLLACDSSEPR